MDNNEIATEIANRIIVQKLSRIALYTNEVDKSSETISKIYGKTFSAILSVLNEIDSIPTS